uniref:G-protein coupled receptors family 1 profile domain-containing protein n=1 Tax=Plectus sambesii TaxID=2011161 RepID=A0A914XN24_9BILA
MNKSFHHHIPLDVDVSSDCAVGCLVIYYAMMVAFLASLPVHFCYLASIIKFNNEAYYKGPFFTLAVTVGIADLGQSFVTWLFSRLMSHLLYMPALLSISWFFLCSQVLGVLLISFERFSAVVHPEKHATSWRRGRVMKLIIVQWLLAFIFAAPNNLIEFSLHHQNASWVANWVWDVTQMDVAEFAEVYYAMGNLLFFMIIAVVLLPVLFIFICFKVWHHKSSEHCCCEYNSYECTMDSHEFRLAAVATIYMLMLALTYIAEFIFVLYDSNSITLYMPYSVLFDIFNVSKPFVCLALSVPARLYFWKFIRCQPAISPNRRHSRVAPRHPDDQITSRF